MICPQTKAKCGHLAFCDITGKCMNYEVGLMDQVDAEVRATIAAVAPPNNHQPKTELGKQLIDLRAKAVADGMPLEPPKPTMAEIERLFDVAVGEAVVYNEHRLVGLGPSKAIAARSALLAAIRAYGEG